MNILKKLKIILLKAERYRNPPLHKGRRRSKKIVECKNCGWLGYLKDCIHSYETDREGDVTDFIEYCPDCMSKEIDF